MFKTSSYPPYMEVRTVGTLRKCGDDVFVLTPISYDICSYEGILRDVCGLQQIYPGLIEDSRKSIHRRASTHAKAKV